MDTHLEAYQALIEDLDRNLKILLFKLGEKPRKAIIQIVYSISQILMFVYLLLFHTNDFFVIVQQVWASIAVAQVPSRCINFVVHWSEMEELLTWYQSIYSTKLRPEYQPLLEKHLEMQNREITMAFRVLKTVLVTGAFVYVGQPLILGTGMNSTPVVWNGTPADQLPWDFYLLFAVLFTYNCFNIYHSSFTNEGFFAICVSVLGHRFSLIGDILKLLNYEGERDRVKDRRILKDAHLMHLEVLQKTGQFVTFFNMYGLLHVASPLFINSVLLYNLLERGFDLMSAAVAFAMFMQIVIVCVFAEMLQSHAEDFSLSLGLLNWYDLHVEERKYLLMIMLGTQKVVSVTAGNFYKLNFALVTQVAKLQASFCAFLQNV